MKHQNVFRIAGLLVLIFLVGCSSPNVTHHQGQIIQQSQPPTVEQYRNAAAMGNAEAQFGLAVMYYEGQGVPQDYSEAAKWFRALVIVSATLGAPASC